MVMILLLIKNLNEPAQITIYSTDQVISKTVLLV